ncbi:unnamed protein product [Cuscuta campestris]|uniref:Uncharacterized protein n=1 Tax=Cuscuta campestris TaxID=132261 RepID=A0A484LRZ1_9ASTE|nr:unnamed protein product [Cuscuta campestris]
MMNDDRYSSTLVDLSRYFLFEATGDSSEARSSVLNQDSAAGNDDALSYSGRRSVIAGDRKGDGYPPELADDACSRRLWCEENGHIYYSTPDEEDDEGEEVNQRWLATADRGKKVAMRQESKIWPLRTAGGRNDRTAKIEEASVCNLEKIGEKERDRLFWEACLSS